MEGISRQFKASSSRFTYSCRAWLLLYGLLDVLHRLYALLRWSQEVIELRRTQVNQFELVADVFKVGLTSVRANAAEKAMVDKLV